MYTYFPSCNLTKASRESSLKMRRYLKERMPVEGCCLYYQKTFNLDDIGLIVCQACREHLQEKIPEDKLMSLWEYLDTLEDFPWPDYKGKVMTLQDCWRDRNHPEVHEAVRHLLKRMNIGIVEIANNRENANFCGTLHMVPQLKENIKRMEANGEMKISKMPESDQAAFMAEQVAKYTIPEVVCYCNRCVKGIELGGGKAIHLMDLVARDL